MSDGLFTRRVLRHDGDREVHLGKTLAAAGNHNCSSAQRTTASAAATASAWASGEIASSMPG